MVTDFVYIRLKLTFVFSDHSRVDTERFLEVNLKTAAAADRQMNHTGSVWRVWRSRQTEGFTPPKYMTYNHIHLGNMGF